MHNRWCRSRAPIALVFALTCVLSPEAFIHAPAFALTQPLPQDAPFLAASILTERPLQEVLDESTARHRFLIVVTSPTREKTKANLALWNNPGLVAWCRRHAIVVHITDRKVIETLQQAGLVTGVPDQPLVFRNGKQERIFGSAPKEGGGVAGTRIPQPPKEARTAKDGSITTSIRLVMRLEWTLRSFRTRDEAWHTAHLTSNPPVVPEPKPPLFRDAVPGVAAVNDQPEALFGETAAVDPIARFQAAIVAGSADAPDGKGKPDLATGLMTWLWEEGASRSSPSAFTPVLFGTAARWSKQFAERHPPANTRLDDLRIRAAEELPAILANDIAFYSYLMLCRAGGEHLDALDFLDNALNDPDAGAMMPRADRLILESMLPWVNWADPWQLPGAGSDPGSPVRRLRESLNAKPPRNMPASDWTRVTEFRRWLLATGGARAYALCLAGGPDRAAAAAEIAGTLASAPGMASVVGPGGSIREWLVAGAIGEGEARPEHLEWLKDSPSPTGKRLAEHAAAQIAARGK